MGDEVTPPLVELLSSPSDLLQAPDVSENTLEKIESTKQPRRVKVYEMKGDAWSDRGTGFCQGVVREREAVFHVNSEDTKDAVLLESKIIKDDLYQIQQNTLIVWQEPDGTDVALSFQEEEGCMEIWNFLRHVQKLLNGQEWDGPEDARASAIARNDDDISDDEIDPAGLDPVFLPDPSLARLDEVEEIVHVSMASVGRRESLAKFVLSENYVPKLTAALEIAEDMESVRDLHRLCNIMKALILLNDAAIFECILKDEVFLGVAGILEYDPDFPQHKAEHRKYLGDGSKFKEVVEVKDPEIKRKIHQTFRLQYLKDVVLARILDDPTFSILNTLIFFNQVDIIQHFQHNEDFLISLFGLFDPKTSMTQAAEKRPDAVAFIQQFTGIAKTLQAPARTSLYKTFIEHGLFQVLVYSLGDGAAPSVRLAGADIVMAVIDHDPKLIRGFIIEQSTEKEFTLCSTLVSLLIGEKDLGVKAQMTEAMRLLVDPAAGPPADGMGSSRPSEVVLRHRKDDPEAEKFLELFYSRDINTLMAPLLETDFARLKTITFEQTALFTHLCDLLCFFIRAHTFRSKFFILSQGISVAISRIFLTNERHLQLAALRYFRVCIGMNDEFYNRHLIKNNLFEPVVDLLLLCSHRDNLLNSAILEFFETIRRENMKAIIYNLVENCRSKLETMKSDTVRSLIYKYEQYEAPPPPPESTLVDENHNPDDGRWQQQKELETVQQEYFEQDGGQSTQPLRIIPTKRPLVDADYDDDELQTTTGPEQQADIDASEVGEVGHKAELPASVPAVEQNESDLEAVAASVDDKIGEKRRRSRDDEDSGELLRSKKSTAVEGRRNSGSPGGLASAVKKKMLFTFGKKEKEKERN
ncbi:Putative uncharacterized protein [Taphrina deformans PYCC 5710]|uniref:Uncharacterized protein n=1 Tax=Taphrina deformans (strain PYCC 5710 / ATCC 11124 / CBS 356.35 / IMI 108563 / JCM 9778 / NBRC 8474) TaxID=1097556 RepID=R4XF47_TAPDE|nr:Putative uncharacterized protein [Taphrina deformans PYCC 5710]|eukprot:CCG81982.1 Putative uncharacterized protein [Taphrina deformans PYCC 5710]